jgi:21S rRNA (uridine2791-2'-O)-methyltransferase
VSTIQGNFLSSEIQDEVRAYVRDPDLGRPRKHITSNANEGLTEEELDDIERGYIDIERHAHLEGVEMETIGQSAEKQEVEGRRAKLSLKDRDIQQGRAVDVVLSDMSAPWDQTAGFYKRSLSDPYFRMMNTSGNAFRDHAGSIVSLPNLPIIC